MSELPPPDVMDRAGRSRRLVLSCVVGVVCAGSAYAIAHAVIPARELDQPFEFISHNMSATGFIHWLTAVTFAVTLSITLAATTAIAKRKWRRSRDLPEAKQVTPS